MRKFTFQQLREMGFESVRLLLEKQALKITRQRQELRRMNKKQRNVLDSARAQEFGRTSVAELSHEVQKVKEENRGIYLDNLKIREQSSILVMRVHDLEERLSIVRDNKVAE